MRRIGIIGCALLLTSTACLGAFGSGGESRTIFVDYSHDEFASFILENFPAKVQVHPGTTLVFKQTWTGEPHTVTGGTLVDETLGAASDWLTFFDGFEALAAQGVPFPNPDEPGDATAAEFAEALKGAEDAEVRDETIAAWDGLRAQGVPLPDLDEPGDMSFAELVQIVDEESEAALEGLPWAMDENEDGEFFITQNAGQPCYLTEGGPPSEPDEPCAETQQEQPVFDGTHSYYNSGLIPYEGQGGNTFEVSLADDVDPGTYWFYCAVHGPMQSTEVEVVESDVDVPSEEEVAGEARREVSEILEPFEQLFRTATDEGSVEIMGERLEGPFAGLIDPENFHAAINEFVPKQMNVEAGEPITWKILGPDHSISFDVPEYFPIMEFLDDGTIRLNPRLQPHAGGATDPAPFLEGGEGEGEGEGPPGPVAIDGGTYDGEGFWSSGLISAEPYIEYTLRISKPGTYSYACLIHPAMVGTIEVV